MIAKVIAHDHDRDSALARLQRALEETAVLGVASNLGHLLDLIADDDVRAGRLDTQLVQRKLESASRRPVEPLSPELVAIALFAARRRSPRRDLEAQTTIPSPWTSLAGWRAGGERS
jgi:acetyl-CoA/propionyl-CoA carboxylase biotin carboxyl carrier protein